MADYQIKTVVLSSLYKVFPEIDPQGSEKTTFSAMKNEPLSFQVAYKFMATTVPSMAFFARIESDLPITIYDEGFVPVLDADKPNLQDKYRTGLFADMLIPKKVNPKIEVGNYPWRGYYFEKDDIQLHASKDSWKALWLTINEDGKPIKAGIHTIKVKLYSRDDNKLVGECSVSVNIIDAKLPKQKLLYTNWFFCDCIADIYKVEVFSERFWQIFRSFASMAAKNGMNMILTPCFTPALDTAIDRERMTVQLVKVTVKDNKYEFDFSMLKRFIDESLKCGITHFEHAHFFTQWGALHAPKIIASVNGKEKQIFGWKTTSWGKKYTEFLHAYIPALLDFLKSQGIDKKFLFHISDEPSPRMKADYLKAKGAIGNLLDGYLVGDALSNYEFYADGTVTTPIVATDHVSSFYGKCPNLWCYYTGDQCHQGYSNRKITNSSERNRMLGVHMYTHKIKGFLHWGYNYYYDSLSYGLFNPQTCPTLYLGSGGGTSFFVYPALDGSAIQSIRQKVFYEAINDMRAFELYEKLKGRKAAMSLIEKHYGEVTFATGAESQEKLLGLREELNSAIIEAIK